MPESLAPAAEPAPGARAEDARLTGAPLALARAAWLVTTVVSVGLLVVAMPLAYQQISTPHTGPQCADSRFSPAQFAALHAAGVSPASLALWIIAFQCFMTLVFVGVGALLFWRRSENRVALLAATWLVLFGTVPNDPHWLGAACALRPTWPAAGLLFDLLTAAANLLVPVLFFTFPSGRWVPRWSPWLVLCFTVLTLPATLRPAVLSDFLAGHQWIGNTIFPLLNATVIIAQVYRYRRVSTLAERLQTKWVVLGSGIGVGGVTAFLIWGAFGGFNPTAPWWPLFLGYGGAAALFCFTLIPISLGIALLRSHLFDVDALINRVLVYGLLTGVLALLYFGGVIALQGLVRAITGTTQTPVIVITTLLTAALVRPLRRGLQRGIDQHFYRRKYDAARTLSAFSATLRDEVDLGRLREDLLAVVQETMQPTYTSLWLRSPSPGSPSTPARPLQPS
jgi:hypothetical protein